jgi:hypothetical protein
MAVLSAKCCEETCSASATHAVKVFVPATGYQIGFHNPLSCIFGLRLCYEHALAFPVQEMLHQDSRLRAIFESAARSVRGVPPDFKRAWHVPLSLDAPEFITFEAMGERKQ